MTEAYFHSRCLRTLEDIGDERGREYRMHQEQKKKKQPAPPPQQLNRWAGGTQRGAGLQKKGEIMKTEQIMEVYTTMSHPGHNTLK